MNNRYLYIFDCFNADVCDRYFTKDELPEKSEKAARKLAADYEATLYRIEVDEDGDVVSSEVLYEPAFF